MRGFLRRIAAIARKESTHVMRDPRVFFFALGLPTLLLFLFGYAVSFDVEHIRLVVVDQDHSAESRRLVDRFDSGDLFDVIAWRDSAEEVEPLFRSDHARAAIVIPADYSRTLARGEEAVVQLLLDGADNNSASVSQGYASVIALNASAEQLPDIAGLEGVPIDMRSRTFFNPTLHSATFIVPGLMVVILTMIAVMLTALTVAREFESGSMEQLFTTPVSRLEIVLGKLSPYFVLGLTGTLLVLTAGVYLFGVPVSGNLFLLFGLASLFLLAMFMQGLFISVATKKQAVASQIAIITTLLPSLLLSGFIFPIHNMPGILQALAYALPPSHFVHGIRGILLRGNGLESILPDCAAISVFLLLMLVLTVKKFGRHVA